MARRKAEIVLQQEIQTQEEWDELLNKDGLIVIDAYQSYGGPCTALDSRFKALYNSLGSKILSFARAKADTIAALEDYRGRCEPVFLFYASKELVDVIRGANAPVIMRKIQEQLSNEVKILKGEQQRKVISDPYIVNLKNQRQREASRAQFDRLICYLPDCSETVKEYIMSIGQMMDENYWDVSKLHMEKEVTICIIKPDVIQAHKKDEVIQRIKERGYEILEQKELKMTEEQARECYKNKADSPQFEDLIKYMTSDVSCILALTKGELGQNVIQSWRTDIGLTDTAQAKSENPNSFRALYGTDYIVNAVHGSQSKEAAARELAFFFPNFQVPKIASFRNHRTLALIRPSAYELHRDSIIKRVEDHGFKIAMKKVVKLSREQAEEFYAEHQGKPFFEDLVNEMSSGPMLVLCLVKDNAIQSWREVIGPTEKDRIKEAHGTLRNEFDLSNLSVNSIHGASNEEQVENELHFFFPIEQTVAVIKPGLTPEKRDEIEKRIVESGFLVAGKKQQKITEEIAQAVYQNCADKPYFNDLVGLMTQDDINVLVLSRENAIEGWRQMMGPTDPAKAKEVNPRSLRAIFGEDTLNNAVHGPSNKDQVDHEIKLFFGDVKFDEKGRMHNA